MAKTPKQILHECRVNQEVHPALLSETARRNLTPAWAERFDLERNDWLEQLHLAVTQEGWGILESACAGLVPKGQFLGMAAAAKAIVIPISTPGYLHSLLGLLTGPLVHPETIDPQAKMLWNPALAQQAVGDFKLMLGMLKETNYFDVPHMDAAWVPAVTAGVRFIYYHELGHVVHAQAQGYEMPSWLDPSEAIDPYLPFELVADQFAMSMLLMELRSHKDLLIPGMVGVVLALGLIAMKAHVKPDGSERMHPIKRMNRLFDWAEKAKRLDRCTDEALTASKHCWRSLYSYFSETQGKELPSPIFSLLRQTSQRPTSDWPRASGRVLQWCAFGDRIRVLRTLRSIRDEALARPDDERARGLLAVIDFMVYDLREVDRVMGLSEALL